MYYLNQNENIKQFENAKDYCIAYARFIRSQFNEMSASTITQIIEYVKNHISLKTESLDCEKEERLAVMLSERQGQTQDIVDFLTLILFEDPEVDAYKYLMYLANKEIDGQIHGSAINPVTHFGLCFSIKNDKNIGARYIDINRVYQGLHAIDIFKNEELRNIYNKDFYFTIIDKIYQIPGKNISEFYDNLIMQKSDALSKNLV